jgi:hypothetical protein
MSKDRGQIPPRDLTVAVGMTTRAAELVTHPVVKRHREHAANSGVSPTPLSGSFNVREASVFG